MSSRHVTDLLPLWIEGDLDAREFRAVEAHLAECGHCRAEADALGESQAWLKSAAPPFSTEDRESLRREVLARLQAAPAERRPGPVWWGAAAMAAAASLLIALLHHGRPEIPSVPVPPVASLAPPETAPVAPAPRAVRIARRSPIPRPPDPAAGPGASRIEIQTTNPQIRIIWLARATVPSDGSLHSTQEDL